MRLIMVIDDEPSIRRTLEMVLKRAGCAVVLGPDSLSAER
jgi:DNA-binding NtrC family response regulator